MRVLPGGLKLSEFPPWCVTSSSSLEVGVGFLLDTVMVAIESVVWSLFSIVFGEGSGSCLVELFSGKVIYFCQGCF